MAPEGYVWVLSRHIPFYHASGSRCPRSRCQENGRIFPLRARRLRASSVGRLVLRALEEEEEGREEERDGDRTGESGRRGKEENTKEKAGVGGCEGSLTRLARRPALRYYQPRPQTPIHGHFGGSPQFLGPPTPFTGGPLRATQFFKEHGFLLVQDTSHG